MEVLGRVRSAFEKVLRVGSGFGSGSLMDCFFLGSGWAKALKSRVGSGLESGSARSHPYSILCGGVFIDAVMLPVAAVDKYARWVGENPAAATDVEKGVRAATLLVTGEEKTCGFPYFV